MKENNCAVEKNFENSWLSDILDRNSCPGRFCANIVKDYLCCSYREHNANEYSTAYGIYGVLHCKYVNVESIVGVSAIGVTIIALFLGLTIFAIIQQSRVKRTVEIH